MRLCGSLAVCSLIVLCLSGPGFAQDDAKELEKLEGSWKIESAMENGVLVQGEDLAQITKIIFTIKGNKLTPSDNPTDFLTLKIDASKKPAEIDLTEKDMKVSKGIYKLEDSVLRLCFSDGERPKEFTSTMANKAILLVLKKSAK